MKRRTALQAMAAGLGALAWRRELWAAVAEEARHDYFVIVHAEGGWDVTLWSDPRNERKGLVEPASTSTVDPGGIRRWKNAKFEGGLTFEPVTPPGSNLRLGPAIGGLFDIHDRITVINGIAMNTVSHDDGTTYAITGRHRTGGIIPQASIDVLLAHERGATQLMPDVSIKFPSSFVGDQLDRRAIPMRASTLEAIAKSFTRAEEPVTAVDRAAISQLLVHESGQLAHDSSFPEAYEQLASQQAALPRLLDGELARAFAPAALTKAYPLLATPNGLRAAFAMEAIKRDLVRCVAFGIGGLDTHFANYRQHPRTLQELFDAVAAMIVVADQTPHPTKQGAKLSDHLHVLVLSEFCRTPGINLAGGRDHYPNNSALVVSPKFKRGRTFGETDPEQLLPKEFGTFSDGRRALSPSDVLATFLGAFGIDPRRHLRDGEVVRAMLA